MRRRQTIPSQFITTLVVLVLLLSFGQSAQAFRSNIAFWGGDPCLRQVPVGTRCDGGGIYAGALGGSRYMTTEGGCHTTPCTGSDSAMATQHEASAICNALIHGGYDDWYLPSEAELSLLYSNRAMIQGFRTNFSSWYSSSSTGVILFFTGPRQIEFGSGSSATGFSSDSIYYRCIRRF